MYNELKQANENSYCLFTNNDQNYNYQSQDLPSQNEVNQVQSPCEYNSINYVDDSSNKKNSETPIYDNSQPQDYPIAPISDNCQIEVKENVQSIFKFEKEDNRQSLETLTIPKEKEVYAKKDYISYLDNEVYGKEKKCCSCDKIIECCEPFCDMLRCRCCESSCCDDCRTCMTNVLIGIVVLAALAGFIFLCIRYPQVFFIFLFIFSLKKK